MKILFLLVTLLIVAKGQTSQAVQGRYSVNYISSANFSVDSYGPLDTRPGTWGHADHTIFPLTFTPPPGYRVRILKINGDLVSWPKVLPGQPAVPDAAASGVLIGFQTTAPDASTRCDYCADNTMLYIQDALTNKPIRTPYSVDVSAGGLLETDNKLIIKVAQWLNTTGYPIHMEPTFTVTYRFERSSS
jgi:hypothetical protein